MSNGNGNTGRSGYQPGSVAKIVSSALVIGLITLIIGFIASRAGCVNLSTPPGHEGYLRSNPFAGQSAFVGIQDGPTSTGWVGSSISRISTPSV